MEENRASDRWAGLHSQGEKNKKKESQQNRKDQSPLINKMLLYASANCCTDTRACQCWTLCPLWPPPNYILFRYQRHKSMHLLNWAWKNPVRDIDCPTPSLEDKTTFKCNCLFTFLKYRLCQSAIESLSVLIQTKPVETNFCPVFFWFPQEFVCA